MGKVLVDHVVLDRETGLLVYRRRFPQGLSAFVPRADGRGMGRKEFRRSLQGTTMSEPGVAQRWQAAEAEYAQIATSAKAALAIHLKQASGAFDTLDDGLIGRLLDHYRHSELADDQRARFDPEVKARGEFVTSAAERAGYNLPPVRASARWTQGFRLAQEAALSVYRDFSADGDLEGILRSWSDEAAKLAAASGYLLDRSTPAFRELCIRLNETAIGVHEAELQRLDGKIVETPPPPLEPSWRQPQRRDQPLPLQDLFDAYSKAVDHSTRTRSEWRRAIEAFCSYLGHSDAQDVTVDDVVRWKDHLLATPTRSGGLRNAVTVNDKYLMPLRCTLQYGLDDLKRLPSNVAAGVRARKQKRTKTRESYFTPDEARAILRASLVPPQERLSSPSVLARRWVPWLCAYSGARVGEVAQLRKEDITEVDGVWVMNLTPEAGTLKTREARLVPLHDHLIEQGFMDVVLGHPGGPLFYNPSGRRAEGVDVNRHAAKVGERIRDWVRNVVGITDPEVQPNHAWRHLFKTVAEEAGIQERVSDAITGHSPANVSRRYGGSTVASKAAALKLFPRFHLGAAEGE